MDKLITFAVPCYNSAAYMEHCVDTLLQGGSDIEIILVDDLAPPGRHPSHLRPVSGAVSRHRPGHPPAQRRPRRGVNQGIRNARGVYYKVVDSGDWVDVPPCKGAGQAAPVRAGQQAGGHDGVQLCL